MAKGEPEKTVKLWMKRIQSAKKAQEEWEQKYEVVKCRQYWSGCQTEMAEDQEGPPQRKAQVNRILPTVRSRIPGMFFYDPFARVVASPSKSDTPGETVDEKAQLLQDSANALVRDSRCGLKEQALISLKESHWAFGCIEVGYSADFADNPALKDAAPPLKEDEHTEGVKAYPKIITEEWIWTRRIPARQVLVSCPESTTVDELDWIGYWEDYHVEDVKKAPAYKNTSELKGSTGEQKDDDVDTSANDVRLYKIWDQRTKTRYVFAEGHKKCLLDEEYKRRKLFFLRFEIEPDKFRPIPPIHNWLDRQDQMNVAYDALRVDLQTRVRRYTVDTGGIDPSELEKFESNTPNTWIKRNNNAAPTVIAPVEQPQMSGEIVQMIEIARRDFDEVSGVGAEARQQASSDTATQAAIMNQRQTIQDSFDRYIVARWLSEIIREMVLLAIDKLTLPQWIMLNSDPNSQFFPQDAMKIAQNFQQITAQQMQEADDMLRWDITVDVESLSPVSEQEKQAQWMQALNLISNPMVGPLLAMSPELLKRTLDLNGIKNGRDQDAIGKALVMKMQMEMQMAQAQQGAPPGVAPMPGAPQGPGGPGAAVPRPPQLIPGPGEGMAS